ncbi:GIY-YIG nuclease family protein [Fundidesulfovibrio soli]|uniref:GIY-YIG nuclease family protein n=1 Tax=Fundidesulfovibrio soli TaxID=2922716 RepID=UPI001FAF6B3C|nr:GIY-YIG nuclease family protein [Fundidesulfovibrio soli]
MDWAVYLLRCSDGTLYCGVTRDVERRLAEHNGLRAGGAKYTMSRRPVELVAAVPASDRAEALRLELRVKRMRRADKLAFFTRGVPAAETSG